MYIKKFKTILPSLSIERKISTYDGVTGFYWPPHDPACDCPLCANFGRLTFDFIKNTTKVIFIIFSHSREGTQNHLKKYWPQIRPLIVSDIVFSFAGL